jgi:hypothetical protein
MEVPTSEFSSEHKYAEPLVFFQKKTQKKEPKWATSDRDIQMSNKVLKGGQRTKQRERGNSMSLRRSNTQREQ